MIKFTEAELVLIHYYSRGVNDTIVLSERMGKSRVQIYNIVKSLKKKGILSNRKGIELSADPFSIRLMNIMRISEHRSELLSNSGLEIVTLLQEPKTIEELESDLEISKPSIYRWLRTARCSGAIVKNDHRYEINTRMWTGLSELAKSAEDRERTFDIRIPRDSMILLKNGDEAIFSNSRKLDFNPTAFSVIGMFDEFLCFPEGFYTTSNKTMDTDVAFEDAFSIVNTCNEFRWKLMLMLFYERNRGLVNPSAEYLEIHNRIMSGDLISGWPSKKDITSRI